MDGLDDVLWRSLNRMLLILVIGVLGLLLGLGQRPERFQSCYGVFLVLIALIPAGAGLRRLPISFRRLARVLPRRRPFVILQAALLIFVMLMVACWTAANALTPGTLSPLALALLGVAAASVTALLARFRRSRH